MNMLAVMALRLRQFVTLTENLSLKEVPARLAVHLLLLANEQEENTEVRLSITKAQLASYLGTIPETLSRILKKMSGLGLIEVEGRRIKIKDRQGLEFLAENGKLEAED